MLRGAIARGLVAHGFLPALGLFHRSEQNAFNLADDIIEPFRPLVDLHAVLHAEGKDDDLEPADKVSLVGLLNVDMSMPRGVTSVLSAVEQTVESLGRLYEDSAGVCLELPTLIGLQTHQYEC